MSQYNILNDVAKYALEYLDHLSDRRVFPSEASLQQLQYFSSSLSEDGKDYEQIIHQLHAIGSQNTVATNGGRYFGFVFGGTLPASMAANWMATAWDQNAVFKISSPVATHLEKIAANWLLELLQLPSSSAVGFVTGTTMANFSGAIAARYHLSKQMGWDIKSKGMNGAPTIRVVVGEEVHASMQRALLLAGFGLDNLIKVPTDEQGRIIPDNFPELDALTFVCLQAGNVNTGAIDPVKTICIAAKEKGAWVHIDGAFGLWARASSNKIQMTDGSELADSWAVDLHKWLNVPYDSGLVICRHPQILQNALSVTAAYLPEVSEPDQFFYTPEMSRRARGIDTWAAISSLGKKGVVDLIERCCSLAEKFADDLRNAGFEILNEVVLNQVLVSFGDAEATNRIIKKIQEDGTCWCGGTVWKGKTAMRISVSSWMTTEEDIDLCSKTITRIAKKELELVQ
jgi:glutamate/tyrosine decarboxylase-like PLP-dependent enzyme